MRKFSVLGVCIAFLLVAGQVAFAGWPGGSWKTEAIATDDTVHQNESSATLSGNKWTITAAGDDIWGEADQFMFVYKEVTGDFDVSCTVLTLDGSMNDWAKAGLMAREDLTPGAKNVTVACRGLDDLVTFQRREEADGSSASERVTPAGAPRPITIRLTRTGNEFMGGWSLDGGATWEDSVTKDGVTPTPPAVVEMADPVLIGIAVTSHEVGVLTMAEVEVHGDPTAVRPEEKLTGTWGAIKGY